MCESGPGWSCGAKLTCRRKRLRSTSAPGRSPLLVLHFIPPPSFSPSLSLSLSLSIHQRFAPVFLLLTLIRNSMWCTSEIAPYSLSTKIESVTFNISHLKRDSDWTNRLRWKTLGFWEYDSWLMLDVGFLFFFFENAMLGTLPICWKLAICFCSKCPNVQYTNYNAWYNISDLFLSCFHAQNILERLYSYYELKIFKIILS